MPAKRQEGLFFHGSPWESFTAPEVQSVLSPLQSLPFQIDTEPGKHILMAFPIVAYEIINDTAMQRDTRHFILLYQRVPVLCSQLLVAATAYLKQPRAQWDIRRALLEYSNEFVWIKRAKNPDGPVPEL